MFSGGGFDQAQYVILQAAVTEKSLSLFQNLKYLTRLIIRSDTVGIDEVKRFKSSKEDCYVEFKGQEVMA